MPQLLSPKQVARALDVSESSVKRWCDKDLIKTSYTAGGHRRISITDLIEFLKQSKRTLPNPEVVGLPSASTQSQRAVDRAAETLIEALTAGSEAKCRQIIVDLYLAENSLAKICDEVIAPAFWQVGEQWECGQTEVYQERQACEICLRIIRELRSLLPELPATAPLAIGCATAGDLYALPTAMVELVLRGAGWQARSLGGNLPCETIAVAIQNHRPRLFWLSVSQIDEETAFLQDYERLYKEFCSQVTFVVGGRALTEHIRQQMQFAAYCDNLQSLVTFAQTLRTE